MAALNKAFKLAAGTKEAHDVEDEVGFFEAVRAAFGKTDSSGASHTPLGRDAAIQQLISESVASTDIVDVLAAAGMKNPNFQS